MRRLLRPGVRVLERSPGEVQLGLDPDRALVLAATPALRRGLAQVVRGRVDRAPDELVRRLEVAGLLVDGRPLRHGPSGPAVSALLHEAADLDALLARRAATRVAVRSFGGGWPLPLEGTGLTLVRPGDPADLVVLVGLGEPEREWTDGHVRDGVPHLVARLTEGVVELGPFVVPGRTACLRCVDAHHTDRDPRWPLLVAQHARATRTPRADGVADPADPVLVQLAAAWLVRDVLAWVDGHRPSTWSATVRLPPRLAGLESVRWSRHAGCGCTWDLPNPARASGPADTMTG